MTVEQTRETRGFQAEVTQLLDLMIHSLYSNKEIFLRELISNASDAIDKLRFESLSRPELAQGEGALTIRVAYDREARTLTVTDNGIGMSRDEVVDNIGTIAKSGTREFLASLTGDQRKDAQLIGQFGVGFYSSFIVADRVEVLTRRAGLPDSEAVRWESEGQGTYTLEQAVKETPGTDVTLHLREGEDEFLEGHRLRAIIRKYSDHISVPIMMPREASGTDDAEGAEGEETVNRAAALWTRGKNEITDEEYAEFYRHIAHDFGEPLARVHSHMEGKYEYTLLLYIPGRAPFDLWDRDSTHGVKLYVRRIFILEDAHRLLPRYLRFVRGVIDSSDLPLNVSREMLQHSRVVEAIRSGAVKKVLGLLEDLAANSPETYATFWGEFGRVLKEGVAEDSANKESIGKLLRFASTHGSGDAQEVSLDTYIARMQEGQDKIYYLTAESFAAATNSPLLELFRKKGVEVLLLTDVVDNWLVNYLDQYNGKALQSVAKADLDLATPADEGEKTAREQARTEFSGVTDRLKGVLEQRVKDVRVTSRLTTSPACLVTEAYDLDPHVARLLKEAGHAVPQTKPILEVNPEHPLLARMSAEEDQQRFADWAQILLDQAILSEGGQLEDPAGFVRRLNEVLVAQGS